MKNGRPKFPIAASWVAPMWLVHFVRRQRTWLRQGEKSKVRQKDLSLGPGRQVLPEISIAGSKNPIYILIRSIWTLVKLEGYRSMPRIRVHCLSVLVLLHISYVLSSSAANRLYSPY